MRILFISELAPPDYSGAGEAIARTARHLKDRGVEVSILATRGDGREPLQDVLPGGVPIVRFRGRLPPWFHLRCALWLWGHQDCCDVIQFSNMPRCWLPVRTAARLLGKRIFLRMTLVGGDDLQALHRAKLRLLSYRNVDGIWAMGQEFINRSASYLKDPRRLWLIPKMLDPSAFRPPHGPAEKARVRATLGIAPQTRVAVFVGSVSTRKGVDLLIDAWADVVRRVPDVILYIVGPREKANGRPYPHSADMDRRIDELGLRPHVVFTGHVACASEYLRAADVFVFPSRQEATHPNALLEAMASGLPAIVCRQPWLPADLILNDATGILCAPEPASIANGIVTLLEDRDQAARLAHAARAVLCQRHDPGHIVDQLLAMYAPSP